jgi:MFS family permease
MIAGPRCFTPQAASPRLPLFLPVERRSSAIAFLFVGWSLASAIGIPLVNLISGLIGWQAVYIGMASGLRPDSLGSRRYRSRRPAGAPPVPGGLAKAFE